MDDRLGAHGAADELVNQFLGDRREYRAAAVAVFVLRGLDALDRQAMPRIRKTGSPASKPTVSPLKLPALCTLGANPSRDIAAS